MKKLLVFMLAVASFSSMAREGFITTTKKMDGGKLLETFKKSVIYDYFQDTFSGESNCEVRFISTAGNDYAEFMMIENGKVIRFYITDENTYTFTTEQSDGSDGEEIGWWTTNTIKAGKYALDLSLEGDSGFNIYYSKNGKRILECDTGF